MLARVIVSFEAERAAVDCEISIHSLVSLNPSRIAKKTGFSSLIIIFVSSAQPLSLSQWNQSMAALRHGPPQKPSLLFD
jgi:hypothetical protein